MKIEEIKKQMLEYRDYFGSPLVNSDDIEACENTEDLADLLDYHEQFIGDQCNDAQNGVNRFKRSLGLYQL